MPKALKQTADARRWEAESDARTLADAKVIGKDSRRQNAAKAAAGRMAGDQEKEAKAMRSVAKKPAKPAKRASPAKRAKGGRARTKRGRR